MVRFGGIAGSFGLEMGILARLRLAKIRTMARPNSPDMPPKRTKKVRLGIISTCLEGPVPAVFLLIKYSAVTFKFSCYRVELRVKSISFTPFVSYDVILQRKS